MCQCDCKCEFIGLETVMGLREPNPAPEVFDSNSDLRKRIDSILENLSSKTWELYPDVVDSTAKIVERERSILVDSQTEYVT